MEKKINLSSQEYKELQKFCQLNSLDEDKLIQNSFKKGLKIEMYGLLNPDQPTQEVQEKIVEKEVVKYVEVIKEIEVPKIEYVEIPVEVVKEVIKEVEKIVEVPVEKIVHKEGETIEVIKEVEKIIEVPVEVIKEVVVEKQSDVSKLKALEQTLQKLKTDNIEKDKRIKQLEQSILEQQKNNPNPATFLRGSNLRDKLF